MELVISDIVVRVLYGAKSMEKMEYTINPQMTKTELVPPNKTKSTTNDMTVLKEKRFLKDVTSKTIFAWQLA